MTDPWSIPAQVARVEEISALGALEPDTVAPDLQSLLELAVQFCGVSSAAVNIVTEDSQHQIAVVGVEATVCTSAESMCAVVLDQPTLSVGNTVEDPRFATNPFVDGRRDELRFYASTPLISSRGVVIGRFCIFDTEPRTLTGDQEDALEVLAARGMDLLELRRRTRDLEASNARLSDFASQVGHDLSSPLAAMLLYLELAQEQPEVVAGSALHGMLSRTAAMTRRMGMQIEGILRSAHQEVPVDLQQVDLGDVVDFVLVDLAAAIAGSAAEVTRGDLPVLRADPEQVYSLMLNLVSNALKFTRPGVPAQVHVTAVLEAATPGDPEGADGVWVVDVTDEGRGVPEADRQRVFARYTRGHEQDTVGHGIGLATARGIAEAHGGTLTLHPRDTGTLMRLRLPA
ncbi:GAF domain-containing sensor histidine kinase [Nocardioides sp. HDW12B]|uniref:sensor histidine kinase n=1 Tax=Nocardioides sp. HDW12B TaxID=2714939 RepID=UPI00140C874B|nr:GAF domain-containing sensor histidine kinase [Nocardioides sp. HDW12B]QIK65971.1 GAF domain-containing sensor histidine kinase [Nocardioides sp. HDW12B]